MYYPICERMCEAFSISSFRHITLPHPSFYLTITATKSLLTLQYFTMKNQEDIQVGGKRALLYRYTTVEKSGVNTFSDKEVDKEVPCSPLVHFIW